MVAPAVQQEQPCGYRRTVLTVVPVAGLQLMEPPWKFWKQAPFPNVQDVAAMG